MQQSLRILIITITLLLTWQGFVWLTHLPNFILPTPIEVFKTLWQQKFLILQQSIPTLIETLLGLFLALVLGSVVAINMIWFRHVRYWVKPILILSQALPTFAIAPLFVIWFGYGMASKIATTLLMLFFPIASSFFDGLRHTEKGWLDLAHTFNATRWQTIRHIRIPAALPHLAAGIRVATAAAPIGAIVGEWVGSSNGLGFLMLNANARMQIDMVFAVLFVIIVFGLGLFYCVDYMLRKIIFWQKENIHD